jgi:hypothetical protein
MAVIIGRGDWGRRDKNVVLLSHARIYIHLYSHVWPQDDACGHRGRKPNGSFEPLDRQTVYERFKWKCNVSFINRNI